jgi:peptide/nickel transport system ATP-binding protein
MNDTLIDIKDLRVEFDVRAGIVKAVDGVSFDIKRGQTMGVIGESGCGKSMTARAILQMIPKPGKITHGEVLYYRKVKGDRDGRCGEYHQVTFRW